MNDLSHPTPEVALESTVMTHGLPRPLNRRAMREMMGAVRAGGAVPRVAGVLAGVPKMGLSEEELDHLARVSEVRKCSLRDLPILGSTGKDGGTTVSATLFLALRAGVRVFATGGIGGVHRGDSGDVSADLPALATLPGTVVCSGAKSILDLPRTRERLETDGVTVLGYQTDTFPAFTCGDSGLPVDQRVDSPGEVARIVRARDTLGLRASVLVCVPCPLDVALDPVEMEHLLHTARREAETRGIAGKEVTPFLLARMAEQTEGRSLIANQALLNHNARVAAEIAVAMASA